MPAVFISYRRADSASAAGRLDDQLVARFGRANVFKDVDSIPPGVDFARYIEDAIRRSHVVLVVIGPRWLTASAGLLRRRLDDPADFVRLEIETALRLGVPIIPLLVDGATMPPAARLPTALRPLATLNALPVRPDPDFHRDIERAIPAIERLLSGPPPAPPEPALPQAPAILEMPDPLPTHQRLSEAALSEQETPLPQEKTHKRPPIALAKRLGIKPSRRSAPGTLVATISAIALIAVAATLLFSSEGRGFLGAFAPSPTNTPDSAAKTAQAALSTEAVTQTAQAFQLTQPYQRARVGPCDKIDPTPASARDSSQYWNWSRDTRNGVTCSADGIAKIAGYGTLAFYGFYLGFPRAFRATLTLSFHPTGASPACVLLYLDASDPSLIPYSVNLCSDGTWWLQGSVTHQSSIATNGVFRVTITVKNQTIGINANGHIVLEPKDYSGVVTMIGLQGDDMASGSWLGASDFTLTPTISPTATP